MCDIIGSAQYPYFVPMKTSLESLVLFITVSCKVILLFHHGMISYHVLLPFDQSVLVNEYVYVEASSFKQSVCSSIL